MALGKKAYPKATVKKIIKAHSNHGLKKNADVTVSFLPCSVGPPVDASLVILEEETLELTQERPPISRSF
jgi:hypothetical protein